MIHYPIHPHIEAFTTERNDAVPEDIILPVQTHSCHVAVVREEDVFPAGDARNAAAFPNTDARNATLYPDTDALVTNIPNLTIGIRTADCVPVLIADTERMVVAAAHAGWRGTVSRIVTRTIETMQREFGCQPEHLHAIIGPSISPEAFEVGEEVVTQFRDAGFPDDIILSPLARPHINLWQANRWLLTESGIPSAHIHLTGLCTYTHTDRFFSARQEGITTGRLISGIRIISHC